MNLLTQLDIYRTKKILQCGSDCYVVHMLSGIACSTQVIPGLAYLCPYLLVILFLIWFFSKTNIMSRDPKSVKSLARVWFCVGLVFLVGHCCIPWSLTQINTTFAVYSVNNYKIVTLDNTASAMKTTQRAVPSFKKWQILEALHKNWSYIPGGIQIQSRYKSQQQMNTYKNK